MSELVTADRSRDLRAKRIRAGLSPETLGKQLGLDGTTIRNIEAGKKASLRTAHTLAEWVGRDVLDIWPELIGDDTRSAA